MTNTFLIILTLFGLTAYGQENNFVDINNEINLIESDSTLTEAIFDLIGKTDLNKSNSVILRIWHNNKRIYKIVEERLVDYGEIKSTIFLNETSPIKIIETENVYYFLLDSIARKKGYDIDLKEEFKVISYITNWDKKEREVIIKGKPTGEKNITYELNTYEGIIRKAKNLMNE